MIAHVAHLGARRRVEHPGVAPGTMEGSETPRDDALVGPIGGRDDEADTSGMARFGRKEVLACPTCSLTVRS
jgi:hypothetical protein